MPFDELTRFLQDAAQAKELYRVTAEVDADQEAAALVSFLCREFREASPVVLFERVAGRQGQLACNLLGNRRRLLRALGAENFDQVVQRLLAAFSSPAPRSDWKFPLGGTVPQERQRFLPRAVKRGLCQQVLKLGQEVDLGEFPILRSWELESGPALTSALLIAAVPDGPPVVERVALEAIAPDQLQPHWESHHRLPRLVDRARRAGRQLHVAAVLGGDPLLPLALSLPLPEGFDPWLLAGLLRQESVNLIRARTVELDVPAEAEMVIEGLIDAVEPAGAGMLADAGGVLQRRSRLPVINVTAITHRAQPVLPTMVSAGSFSENAVWALLIERCLLHVLRWLHPQLTDLHLPPAGGGRRIAVLGVEGGQAASNRALFHGFQGLPCWGEASTVLLVPSDVNVRDSEAVWQTVSAAAGAELPANQPRLGPLVLDATQPGGDILAAPSEEVLSRLRGKLEKTSWVPAQIAGEKSASGASR